ncbi:MAG: hypothetical protein R3B45_05600 [Bdellovibrionota bacterium]
MNVPEGTYRLQVSSRFTHYSGQLTEPIEIKDDLDMDFSLQRHPYPAGKVSIATDSDNLVRDSMVHLTVETLPGVQYMKVITEQNFEILEDYPLDRWIPVQKSFVFAAKEFGHHRLFFWFQDNNGKISDLIQVSFFRTHFDKVGISLEELSKKTSPSMLMKNCFYSNIFRCGRIGCNYN